MNRMRIGFLILCSFVLFSILGINQTEGFSDLDPEDEKTKYILEFYDRGLINGYADDTFRGEAGITRAEFIALMNRTFQFTLEKENDPTFYDVDVKGWYYKDLQIAMQEGYIRGYVDNTFRPQKPISRQEAAVIINRVLQLEPKEIPQLEDEIDSWAREDVHALLNNHLIFAENGYFMGAVNITRADTVISLLSTLKIRETEEAQEAIRDEQLAPSIPTDPVNTGSQLPMEEANSPTEEVLYAIGQTIEGLNRVLSQSNRYSKDLDEGQLEMVRIMKEDMSKYLSDYQYDYESRATIVGEMYRALSEEQQQTFRNAISYEIPLKYLNTLENFFKKG